MGALVRRARRRAAGETVTDASRVRPATAADVPAIAEFAARLYRLHHRLDPERFWDLGGEGPGPRAGREGFFASQLADAGARLFVGEHAGRVAGYAYATLESNDYENLLERGARLHDVWVEPGARASGLADALFDAVRHEAEAAGARLLVLSVAVANTRAVAFFARHGARRTMQEMAVRLGGGAAPPT